MTATSLRTRSTTTTLVISLLNPRISILEVVRVTRDAMKIVDLDPIEVEDLIRVVQEDTMMMVRLERRLGTMPEIAPREKIALRANKIEMTERDAQ